MTFNTLLTGQKISYINGFDDAQYGNLFDDADQPDPDQYGKGYAKGKHYRRGANYLSRQSWSELCYGDFQCIL
jgi:hypothetical protein